MGPASPFRALAAVLAAALASLSVAAQIRVGQTIDLSGGTAEHGKAMLTGARAYLDPLNAAGGIDGRRIELVTLDDGGKSDKAAQNTETLIAKERVVAIFSGIEGGPCTASLKVATERRVPLLACAAGAPELRDPFNRYSFPMRAAHLSEFEMIVRLARQFGRTRIGFIHADSDTGRRHLANLTRVSGENGVEVVAPIAMKGGAEALAPKEVAQRLVAARAQGVVNHGGYSAYAAIYREAKALDPAIQFYAVNSGAQQMVRLLGESAQGIVFTQVVPFPWGVTPPVVGEYKAAMKRHAPSEELSFSSLEGYLNAKLLVAALRRAGRQPTAESVITALEKGGHFDLGGVIVEYSATRHEGSRFVDTVFARRDGRFITR